MQSKQEFGLDAFDRISVTKSSTGGVQLAESSNRYSADGDSPAWVETKTRPTATAAWDTTWTRNVSSLAGGLGMLQSSDGTARLQLADLRGNVVAATTIGSTGLDSYTTYTEYGTARPGVPDDYQGYGWLGTYSRKSAGNIGGLTLMGARLYNPVTGRFLSRDSVAGGNDNAYVYPADPINKLDLNGQFSFKNIIKAVTKIVRKVVKQTRVNYYRRIEPRKAVAGKRPAAKKGSPRGVEGKKSGKIPLSPAAARFAKRRNPLNPTTTFEFERGPSAGRSRRDVNAIDCGIAVVSVAGAAVVYVWTAPLSVPLTVASAGLGGLSTWCFFRSC